MSKKFYALIFGLIFVSASSISCAVTLSDGEANVLISRLLKLDSQKSDIKFKIDHHKKWGKLYTEYWDKARATPTIDELKIYLLIVFISHQGGGGDTTEHIGETFLSIFKINEDDILNILGDHNFLVRSTCYAISRNFSNAKSKEAEDLEKQIFLKKHKKNIMNLLSSNNMGNVCISQIE